MRETENLRELTVTIVEATAAGQITPPPAPNCPRAAAPIQVDRVAQSGCGIGEGNGRRMYPSPSLFSVDSGRVFRKSRRCAPFENTLCGGVEGWRGGGVEGMDGGMEERRRR